MTISAYQGLGSIEQVMVGRRGGGQGAVRARRDLQPRGGGDPARGPAAVEPRRQHRRAGDHAGRHRLEPGPSGCRDARTRLDRRRVRRHHRPRGSPASTPTPSAPRPGLPVLAPGFGHQGAEPGDIRLRFGALRRRRHRERVAIAARRRDRMDSPTPSRVGPTSMEPRLPETTATTTTARSSPPEVDRVAASRAAVAARRARAAVKADVASGARSPLDVLREAFEAARGRRGSPAGARVPHLDPGDRRDEDARASWRSSASRRRSASAASVGCSAGASASSSPTGSPATAAPAIGSSCSPVRPRSARAPSRRTSAEHHPDVRLSVSATTRAPRPGEVEGEHYYFVDDAEFDRMVAAGELLEWATVHNASRYGTPRRPVEEAIAAGNSVLLEIDIQGARSVRRAMPEATLVFLLPPTLGRTRAPARRPRHREPGRAAAPTRDREGRTGGRRRVRSPGREPRRRRGRAKGRRLDEAPQGSALSCPGRKFPRTTVRTFRSKESVHG